MADSVLLHMCCGPCGLMPVKLLRAEGFAVTGVFYNPNIHPLQEYLKRREAALEAAKRLAMPLLLPVPEEAAWNLPAWLRAMPDCYEEKTARCRACFALRLERVAAWAAEEGFDAFTTSLLYSRHQPHELLVEEGKRAAERAGVIFLHRDFRPAWQEGIALSREWKLYRQSWCACLYSEAERYSNNLRKAGAAVADNPATRPVACPPLTAPEETTRSIPRRLKYGDAPC